MVFSNQYYCLIAGLPELAWDSRKLPVSVAHFRELAGEALSRRDLRVMNLFFLPNDNRQVLRLLRKEAPETGGGGVPGTEIGKFFLQNRRFNDPRRFSFLPCNLKLADCSRRNFREERFFIILSF